MSSSSNVLRAFSCSSSTISSRLARPRGFRRCIRSRLFFRSRPLHAEVLERLAVDLGERLEREDVERAQLGALALGQERRVVERRAGLVCWTRSLNC